MTFVSYAWYLFVLAWHGLRNYLPSHSFPNGSSLLPSVYLYSFYSLELVVAERDLVVTTSTTAVQLGSDRLQRVSGGSMTVWYHAGTHADGGLELGELVLVVLSFGLGVLIEPRRLLLDGLEDRLLVI